MAWLDELKLNADARVAVIHLATIDDRDGMRALAGWSQSGEWPKGMGLITWDIGDQFRQLREPAATFSKLSATPETVLDIIDDYKGSATFVLKDFHHFLEHSRKVSRMLRNLASRLPFRSETVNIIITTPRFALPAELAHDIPTIDVGKPDGRQMLELLERETRSTRSLDNATHGLRERLVESALGLSVVEAGRAFRKAIVVAGGQGLDERSVRQVLNEKRHIIRESGALELYPCTGSMNNVGGLGALKGWLDERQEAFSQDAREYGLSMPKGVALIGIPGTGKSLCAKVTAGHWGMTLLRMDVGAIFSGLLGSSEQNIREAIRIAEVIAPCVLWVDEIEKAFASSDSDGGTSQRILGYFLTWMAERKGKIFLVATANAIDNLPPELLRKGRFDEIFFVDLPVADIRVELFRLHMVKRGLKAESFDLQELATVSAGFSGAEIEQGVVSALYAAHGESAALDQRHLVEELQNTRPLSVVMAEKVARLRAWAAERTVPAD